jgi:hypothetical protein
MMSTLARCFLLALLLPLPGCFYGTSESLPDIEIERLEDWFQDTKSDHGVPGIDYGTVWYVREAEPLNKPLSILWIDGEVASRSLVGKGSSDLEHSQLTLGLKNGKKVVVDCHVRFGKDKPIIELTIDGQRCDFEQGNFFLVSTTGETTKIKQTDRDIGLKGMRFDLESIQETAKTDEEIREFFTTASANKPQP